MQELGIKTGIEAVGSLDELKQKGCIGMTKDKYLTALQIFGLITAVLDFAFIVFAVVSYSLIYVGVILFNHILGLSL